MAADLGDVDDLGALADAEVDGLVGALVEVLEEGHRHLEQGALDGGAHAELEEAAGEAVAVLGLLEQPVVDEVGADAVDRALREPGTTDQLGQGRWRSST